MGGGWQLGSIPSGSTKNAQRRLTLWQDVPLDAGHEASQTATRVLAKGHGTVSCTVRLSVRTPAFHAGKRGSIPLRCTNFVMRLW